MLQETDIADHALNALSNSGIREVHILARRGFRDAAFSVSEFLALGHLRGVDGPLLAQRGAAPLAWKQWQTGRVDTADRA